MTGSSLSAADPVKVGSKRFTESYLLGELVTQALRTSGTTAEHRQGLGNTGILEQALVSGAIDVYLGLSHEFLVRADGWPGLKKAYGLQINAGSGIDHGLAYKALADGQLDIIDVYSTDAQIGRLKLRVLRDDLGYFPRYEAVLLMRDTLDDRVLKARLAGRINEATMRSLNAEVELDRRSFEEVARGWLALGASTPGITGGSITRNDGPGSFDRFISRLLAPDLGRLLRQHLLLVFGSLAIAALIGIPLGVLACRRPALSSTIMALAGLLQTIINVGTAIVAAFVGAGGLGERIVSGLAVSDTTQMLAGAVPAALLAIGMQWAFDAAERLMRPGSSARRSTSSA
jgi:osmoprotectant transport system permease protein